MSKEPEFYKDGGVLRWKDPESIEPIKQWARIYYGDLYKSAIKHESGKGYRIVTRVNHLTALLWLRHRNDIVNKRAGWIELPKCNWLVMIRNFRRQEDEKLKLIKGIAE